MNSSTFHLIHGVLEEIYAILMISSDFIWKKLNFQTPEMYE